MSNQSATTTTQTHWLFSVWYQESDERPERFLVSDFDSGFARFMKDMEDYIFAGEYGDTPSGHRLGCMLVKALKTIKSKLRDDGGYLVILTDTASVQVDRLIVLSDVASAQPPGLVFHEAGDIEFPDWVDVGDLITVHNAEHAAGTMITEEQQLANCAAYAD